MISARIVACIVGSFIAITAQAQNAAEPVLQIEMRDRFGGVVVFDPWRPFSTVLTCDQATDISERICKSYVTINNCQEYFSMVELQSFQDSCRVFRLEQAERSNIYDNCVISKSRGVDSSAMRNVRTLCERISDNPTVLQRWRWGN
jgi:hypothetical protein